MLNCLDTEIPSDFAIVIELIKGAEEDVFDVRGQGQVRVNCKTKISTLVHRVQEILIDVKGEWRNKMRPKFGGAIIRTL